MATKKEGKAASGKRILVKQVRSHIGRDQHVRNALKALGLGRIGKSSELNANPAVAGIIRTVSHLVTVEAA